MLTVVAVFCVGWFLAAALGTVAYFANEPMSESSDV